MKMRQNLIVGLPQGYPDASAAPFCGRANAVAEARKRMTERYQCGKCENTMTNKPNERPSSEKPAAKIEIHAVPQGKWKALGGGDRDQWNERLSDLVIGALPVNQNNAKAVSQAGSAVAAGIVDMKPADPVEGMLISQLVVANEAALNLYRLAWLNNAEYFEASTKYLQLADKASRTVAMLTERLDHHRNQGKQQIVVQHTTTVNANQAVVTDSVVTGKNSEATPSAKVLATVTDNPMEIIEADEKQKTVPGVGGTKAK